MSKIVQVLRRMLAKPDGVTEVFRFGNEFYFRYAGHIFSITRRENPDSERGEFGFYVYPAYDGELRELAAYFDQGLYDDSELKMVGYHSSQIARDEMAQLYQMLHDRYFNLDKIFDDILDEET